MSESQKSTMSPGNRNGPIIVVGLCIVLAYILVWPVGDYVIEDDWAFSLTLRNLHENGELRILHWIPATLVVHLFWGLLFTKVLGFHLTLLKITTVLLMVAGTWAVMDLLRRLDVPPRVIAITGLALVFNPLHFFQSFLYATDIPALAWSSLALLFYFRGLVEDESGPQFRWCWIASAFASLAWGVRQSAVLVVGAVFLHLLIFHRTRLKKLELWLACFLLPVLSVMGFLAWYHGVHGPTGTYLQYRDGVLRSLGHLTLLASAEVLFLLAMYSAFFVLPLAIAFGRSGRGGSRAGGSVVGAAAGLFVLGMFFWVSLGRGVRFPYLQNKITQFGFLSPNEIILGDRPVLWGNTAGWTFSILLVLAALLGGYHMIRGLREGALSRRSSSESEPKGSRRRGALRLVFLLLVLQGIYGFVTMPILFDRHLLILLPTLLILFVVAAGPRSTVRMTVFVPCILFLAFYGITGTHDLHAISRTAFRAGEELRARGVDPQHIDAGLAFDGWHMFQRSLDETEQGLPPLVRRSGEVHDAGYLHNLIPRLRTRHVISLSRTIDSGKWQAALAPWARRGSLGPRLTAYEVQGEYRYRRYWPWGEGKVYALKERSPER